MKLVTLAAGALNQTPLDWDGNRDRILAAIEEARQDGVRLLCLPELCISGYNCEDMFHAPGVWETAWEMLLEIVAETRDIAVAVGLPISHRNALYNCAGMLADGEILGFVAKQHLAGDGIHYEPRWFKAWPRGRIGELERPEGVFPLGDLYFEIGGVRVGFEICEDAWVASRPGSTLAAKAIDVILNPSASHFAFGKQTIRERLVLEGSRAFGVTYVYANPLGNEAGRAIYDGGNLIASAGEIVARAERFSFRETVLTATTVDVELTRSRQGTLASHEPDVGDAPGERIVADLELSPETRNSAAGASPDLVSERPPDWERSDRLKQEEFTRAVTLALFDYLRKSGAKGYVVSLSGGADSSATSCLVALMVERAWKELGREALRSGLDHVEALRGVEEPRGGVERLLTCLYQATRHSSETTRRAAREVADAIGASYYEFDVDPIVESYVDLVEEAIGHDLTWERDDIALQNIQARVRAPSAWMIANVERKILLATSNRSEAAVGYTTMDGDTAGGLSPIAGIDKAFLRRWLHWMQDEGPAGLAPIPELSAVTAQEPTAELRPPEEDQTDEGDLMPYEILDAVERLAIRDKKMPDEILVVLRDRFSEYGEDRLAGWLRRFFRLWSRNQWKRERFAPSFHLDDRNLDPKTWCRFPILSGGYERELRTMETMDSMEPSS